MSDYVESCYGMFLSCGSITKIDLSNFDTSQVIDMSNMFNGCSSLTSLNLSNFDTSQVKGMKYMFNGCKNLEYINLHYFGENKSAECAGVFNNVPDNVVICINENKINKILSQIKTKTCHNIDCTNNWKSR